MSQINIVNKLDLCVFHKDRWGVKYPSYRFYGDTATGAFNNHPINPVEMGTDRLSSVIIIIKVIFNPYSQLSQYCFD